MTLDPNTIKLLAEDNTLADMSIAGKQESRALAAEGPCNLRLVGYVQRGVHTTESPEFGKKTKPMATLFFEVSGPNHPAVVVGGALEHEVKTIDFVHDPHKSPHEKSTDFKIFKALNWRGGKTNYVSLIDETFVGVIKHVTTARGTKFARIALEFKPPTYELVDENGPTGKFAQRTVAPANTPIKLFIFNKPTQETWDSLYIPGEYEARAATADKPAMPAKSKNRIQENIKSAINFPGSAIERMLLGDVTAGGVETLPEAPAEDTYEDDILAGLV